MLNNAAVLRHANALGAQVCGAFTQAGFELGRGGAATPCVTDAESRADLYLLGYFVGGAKGLCAGAAELRGASDRDRADAELNILGTNIVGFFGQTHAPDVLRTCLDVANMKQPAFADGLTAGYAEVAAGKNDELWKHMMRRRMDMNSRG